ncbi:MAG: bifunctional nuclease family protein, partial [Armatimonadota bacterium]
MVRMFVYRVGIDPRGRVLLILADEQVTRLLPMVIGQYEARAIAMELAKERFDRPLTHDLVHSVIS